METKENRATGGGQSAVGNKDLAGSGSKAKLNGIGQTTQDLSGGLDPDLDRLRRDAAKTEFWLHLRARDDKEFYFSTEPTLQTLRVELVAAGIEQTKTRSLQWLPTSSVTNPPTVVKPRGRGWNLHSTAEDHSVWRRNTRKRNYVLHDAANAMEIVYPPARRELELGA